MAKSMIKSKNMGHSPGDAGESLRCLNLPDRREGLTILDDYDVIISPQGDTGEGRTPQRTLFAFAENEILTGFERELVEAIHSGNKVLIRMALYAITVWLTSQQVLGNCEAVGLSSDTIGSIVRVIGEIEQSQGEWYQHQLGCEARMAKRLLSDQRRGLLTINRSELIYAVLPRLHMITAYNLILDKNERSQLASKLALLSWRPTW